ncbi:ferredoxin--NADP reductase [Thalassotalea ponticola]|uniref:ferredoxin--NADP reductase n=1 Tax=Thalassotalea ponticola TaxID=1523392 RepID=UPI0025B38B2D|nr:ferredoxin--NADP reductase [Thalassotalea ponticola]MDN3653802.1 ferredoxin--NADP reductase [Thalassotalea ponticola]
MSLYHALTVMDVRHETADACTFTFGVPTQLADSYAYQAGQFLTLKVPHPEGELLRCYSMCSAPTQTVNDQVQLSITVKRVVDGRASNYLCDNITPGCRLEVMRPSGLFVVNDWQQDLLLFAGGSGITPVFSILKTALAQGSGQIRLIYANRDERSIIFLHELNQLRQQYPERLEVVHLLDSLQGVPRIGLLQSLCYDMQSARAFICGPGPYMDAAETALHNAGFNADTIHVERFVSLDSATAKRDESRPQTPSDSAEASTVTIDLYGTTHVIDCAYGETVLNAAREQGVELPYSCEVGMCASCMCEVTDGDVELRHNDVLTERDLNNGITLTCQAVPKSKTLQLKYT